MCLWTDSKAVPDCLRNKDRNFWIYIAHRVNEILDNTKIEEWYYLSTECNVSDKPPDTLAGSLINWSKVFIDWTFYSAKWSKYVFDYRDKNHLVSKLTRHLAWIIKSKRNWLKWKRGQQCLRRFKLLTLAEIEKKFSVLFYLAQHESFGQDITSISSDRGNCKNSSTISLAWFQYKKNTSAWVVAWNIPLYQAKAKAGTSTFIITNIIFEFRVSIINKKGTVRLSLLPSKIRRELHTIDEENSKGNTTCTLKTFHINWHWLFWSHQSKSL